MSRHLIAALTLTVFGWPSLLAAQGLPLADGNGRPVAVAVRVPEAPPIDADVLSHPVWQSAQPLGDFTQTTPDEGAPSSQRTEVRIVYTDDTLFFGVMCFDTDPGAIIVSDSRRDTPPDDTDSFQIILDTYRDTQNGFVFGTNPAGVEYDGQLSNEGQGGGGMPGGAGGGRQMRGSGGGFNVNWDGSWTVRTRITEQGWSAVFAIPFRTLRYPSAEAQTWGVNFQRNIRRRNESAYWAPLARQFDLYRLTEAGTLTGIAVAAQRNLKITPYVLSELTDERFGDVRTDGDIGADLKYSVTPSLTLDLTVNTDFAQVEVDEEQINLDRFNLFFPEKRPFFLENAGLFSVGNPGAVEVFFSRRIGIGPGGEVIPIRGGGRLTGKIRGTNVGLLNMQTAEESGVAPANNFSVARVSRELPNRSRVGALFVNRTATGDLAGEDDFNRSYAVDARVGVGRYGLISGFAARTSSPGLEGREHAFNLAAAYESPAWRINAGYTEVGDAFNPEVGFLARDGYRNPTFFTMRTFRLGDNRASLHEIRPHVMFQGYWNFEGFQETGFTHIDTHWEWKAGHEVHTGMNLTRQGVVTPFQIFPGITVPQGTYDHAEAMIVSFTNQGHWISFRNTLQAGGFFGGDRVSMSPAVRLRTGEAFNAEVSWSYNNIDLPLGDFTTNLVRTRVSYSFSPRVFVQGLLQYNSRAEIWSTNLRFGWLQAANTGLFVVYNDTQDLSDLSTQNVGRSLVVKFSRLFDVFQ